MKKKDGKPEKKKAAAEKTPASKELMKRRKNYLKQIQEQRAREKEELSRMLPGRPDRARVRSRWIDSPSVRRYERGAISRQEFAAGVIRELDLPLAPDELLAAFAGWARGPYPGAAPLLRRLEDQGLLVSDWRLEGARPRRYYKISPQGTKILERLQSEWTTMAHTMEQLLS